MEGFEYVRNAHRMYQPPTPASALRAIEQGVLPPEAFIYRAGSSKPLFEQPADLGEVQRVLSRPDLDLDTTLLVLDILYEMLGETDPERALFAAESINGIENRYMERIDALLESGDRPSELAVLYYELSRIHRRRQTLRMFYVQEALKWAMATGRIEGATRPRAASPEPPGPDHEDMDALHARLLLELERYDEARRVLESTGRLPHSTSLLLLMAEIEFRQRNFVRVISIFRHMEDHGLVRGSLVEELAAQWGSNSG